MWSSLLLAASLSAHAKNALPVGDVTVPYERVKSGHVVVQVTIGAGAPVAMVVDTGASVSVLTPEAWRAAGGDPDKGLKIQGRGAGGKLTDLRVATGVDFTIGGAPIHVGAAVLMPLEIGMDVGGVLGRDVLRQFVLELDDGSHLLTLHPKGAVLSSEGMEILPMHRVRANLTATVAMVAGSPVEAVIDLGASMSVLNAEASAISGGVPMECEGSAMGVDGVQMAVQCLTLNQISLGSLELGPLRLTTVDLPIFGPLRLADTPAMILGNDVYAGRRVVLDDGRKQLWLSRRVEPAAPL